MEAYSYLRSYHNNEQFTVGKFVSSCLLYMIGIGSENSKYICMKEKCVKIINSTMDGCFEWSKKMRHTVFIGRVRGGSQLVCTYTCTR